MNEQSLKNYVGAVKAGRLANGFERGKGSIVHIIEAQYAGLWAHALCNATPSIAWTERELAHATCPKCIARLGKEVQMQSYLNQIDEMLKEQK